MKSNFKRAIASISTIALAASTFAGFTITASAAEKTVPFVGVERITDNGDVGMLATCTVLFGCSIWLP